ncbi:MAG: methyltransferase domain-containing protein [Lewinellaceae bacterium]|nr:methyltransferase domain-containing protein [Saprospiraceae bacterium]MCB9312234.1 methyltransferase domain-containing protein [Lewinellaceae bacterium]HRW75515.1 class I SAM-dependent methyltransferase [Saprospiraceae bacterium]
MKLHRLQSHWDRLGETDPMWAILTKPGTRGQQWDESSFFQTGRVEIRFRMRDLAERGIYPSGSALDFGCGIGRLSQALAERFDRVTGVDIAPTMIQKAQQLNRFPDSCTYVVNAAPHLQIFPDSAFDFIYSNITLQHMEPEYAFGYLAEFVRCLKPGGTLLFQLPDHESGRGMADTMRRWAKRWLGMRNYRRLSDIGQSLVFGFRPRMEMYGTNPELVRNILEQAGARVLDVWPNDHAGGNWISYWYACSLDPHDMGHDLG